MNLDPIIPLSVVPVCFLYAPYLCFSNVCAPVRGTAPFHAFSSCTHLALSPTLLQSVFPIQGEGKKPKSIPKSKNGINIVEKIIRQILHDVPEDN